MALRGADAGPGGDGLTLWSASNVKDILDDLKDFDRKLATTTRRKLRRSGDVAIADMRAELAKPPPDVATREFGRPQSRGSRAHTAAALKTKVTMGKTRQSIRITGAGDSFSRSYNMKSWRHPIRFNSATTRAKDVPWVEQAGRPYFGTIIGRRWRDIQNNIREAVDEAVNALATSTDVSE